MAASRPGGGGATKIDKRTCNINNPVVILNKPLIIVIITIIYLNDLATSTKPTYREEIEKDWRLILHDDSVHTIQQVCEILSKVCYFPFFNYLQNQ
jgi:hypothetical protein